jgi:hypothetical protein
LEKLSTPDFLARQCGIADSNCRQVPKLSLDLTHFRITLQNNFEAQLILELPTKFILKPNLFLKFIISKAFQYQVFDIIQWEINYHSRAGESHNSADFGSHFGVVTMYFTPLAGWFRFAKRAFGQTQESIFF